MEGLALLLAFGSKFLLVEEFGQQTPRDFSSRWGFVLRGRSIADQLMVHNEGSFLFFGRPGSLVGRFFVSRPHWMASYPGIFRLIADGLAYYHHN
jgi:hypothetical protein